MSDFFWTKVDKSAGPDKCWPWAKGRRADGYGQLRWEGRVVRAHRVAYQLTYGDIASDLVVMHLCDNPPCCNPAHLRLGTCLDNVADRDMKKRSTLHRSDVHDAIRTHRRNISPVWSNIEAIVEAIDNGNETGSSIARKLGVSATNVNKIVLRYRQGR